MYMRLLVLALTCMTVCGFVIAHDAGRAAPMLGLLAISHGKAFVYTTADHLLPGVHIQLQYPDSKGLLKCCIKLSGRSLGRPVAVADSASDALLGHQLYRYEWKTAPDHSKKTAFFGAAVIGGMHVKVETDLESNGEKLRIGDGHGGFQKTIHICLGMEGANLFLIEQREVKQQLYYAFGYEVRQTCDPKLFELRSAQS